MGLKFSSVASLVAASGATTVTIPANAYQGSLSVDTGLPFPSTNHILIANLRDANPINLRDGEILSYSAILFDFISTIRIGFEVRRNTVDLSAVMGFAGYTAGHSHTEFDIGGQTSTDIDVVYGQATDSAYGADVNSVDAIIDWIILRR